MSKEQEVQGISISDPFGMHKFHESAVRMDIDCKHHIDYYDYHDAPPSIYIVLTYAELKKLKEIVDRAIRKSERYEDGV